MGNSILLLWAVAFCLFLTPAGWQVPKSSSVKHWSLQSRDWVDWLCWDHHSGVHILPTDTVAHFTPAPVSTCPWALWLLGDRTRTSLCGASPGFRHGAPIGLQGKQYRVLRQHFLSSCIWWVLVEDLGDEGSQDPLQNIIQNIWTEGKDRDMHGAPSSASKMLQHPLSCWTGPRASTAVIWRWMLLKYIRRKRQQHLQTDYIFTLV